MVKNNVGPVEGGEAILSTADDITLYSMADGQYWRQPVDGGGGTFGQHWNEFRFDVMAKTRLLKMLLETGSWQPPTPNEDGSFTITADGIDDATAIQGFWDLAANQIAELKSFSARGRVSADGVVTEFDSTYQFVSNAGGQLLKWRVEYGVSDIGTATVSEPDWYRTALEEVPSATARMTDGDFVEVRIEDGNRIEPRTFVGLFDETSGAYIGNGRLRDPFEPGTTLYLWLDDGSLRWNRGSRPSTARPDTLDGRLNFEAVRAYAFKYFPPIPIE